LSLDSTLASLAVTFANGFGKGVDNAVKKAEKLTQVYEKDLSKAVTQSRKDQEAINKLQDQANKGKASEAAIASKLAEIESKRQSVLDKIENAKREGLKIDYEEASALVGVYNQQEKITKEIEERVKASNNRRTGNERSQQSVGKGNRPSIRPYRSSTKQSSTTQGCYFTNARVSSVRPIEPANGSWRRCLF